MGRFFARRRVLVGSLLTTPFFACDGGRNPAACASEHESGTGWSDEDPTCTFYPVEHAEACGADCPIVIDVELRCKGAGRPTFDAAVAAGADATYLATDSGASQVNNLVPELFRITTTQNIETISVGADMDFRDVRLAPTPDGSVSLVARSAGGGSNFRFGLIDGSVLLTEPIPGANLPWLSEFMFDASGNAHVWTRIAGDAMHNTRMPDGLWVANTISYGSPFPATSMGFGLRFDENPIVALLTQGTTSPDWSLSIDEGNRTRDLGVINRAGSDLAGSVWSMAAPALPAPNPVVAADAYLKHRPSRLELAWVTPETVEQTVLESTALFSQECSLDRTPQRRSCGSRCEDAGGGVQNGASALARSADGRLWVAWLETQLSRTVCFDFTPKMPEQTFKDTCTAGVYEDESVGEIVLATFDVEARSLQEVFRVPSSAPAPHYPGDLHSEQAGNPAFETLSISAYGTRLSVAARVDPASPSLRVIEVDTSFVP